MIEIIIHQGNKTTKLNTEPGRSLLELLNEHNFEISATCGGKGTCGKCVVEVDEEGLVMACQYPIFFPISIHLPVSAEMQILSGLNHLARDVTLNSGLEIIPSDGHSKILFKGKPLTTIIKNADTKQEILGLAADIGTTTIALYLINLDSYEVIGNRSLLNPQGNYGADVISRIDYCIKEPKGTEKLKNIILRRINETISILCKKHNVSQNDIFIASVVGNTVMQHIFLGVNPSPIAFAPFTPVFTNERDVKASELGLNINSGGLVKVLPSVAGYVGADVVAGIATTNMMDQSEYGLFIDIGTNGEIVIGNKDRLYCCATAAGPAFEGARIKYGIGGVPGAISGFGENHFTTIQNQKPIGICGSGLIDIIAYLLDSGKIEPSGIIEEDFKVVDAPETGINRDIFITQRDIREVQLAKAAIYAGIKIIMKVAGIGFENISQTFLAGGFGNYIRPASAFRMGLLPNELSGKIAQIGNAAGTGSLYATKSINFEKEIKRVLNKSSYVELSMRQDFNDEYVSAMGFYHK
jgi:uncharacterized 2Fe-2S/4Fe-4S cluster protein (DUF4445 family)